MRLQKSILVALFTLLATVLVGTSGANAASCASTESLTEGPYYSTDTPVRSNITAGQVGTKTTLTITVVDKTCKPVKGAKVDIWHASAAGVYSAVEGVAGNFLRGTQVTNAAGKVTFTTIYPGWYPGRTMHIHFKVWRDGSPVLTSQFFASDASNKKVYTQGVYAARGDQNTPAKSDRIYAGLQSPSSLTLKLSIGKNITGSARVVI